MESDGSGLRYRLRRALRQIGAQHRQLHELHARLRRAVASEDRQDAGERFRRYQEAVGAHFALEDDVFFPALHGLHPEQGEALERLGRDHDDLLDELVRLGSLLDRETFAVFGAGFESLRAAFASHEKREEDLVSRLTGASLEG
jgi:hypothetical protein